MTKKLLMGNEAIAHAALEAGVAVVAGYPGTPSSEIVETVARLHAQGSAHGVHVEWSTNEKAALELLFGASLAGARGLFTCKQMGLNVASDALLSLNYVSVRGGLVLVVADDPGPISSQTEQDTRRFAAFAKVPVLDPATPEQAFAMVQAAFDLSERFHTPVIVRPTTRVDHASAFFDVADATEARAIPENGFERDPQKWVIFPRRAFEAHGEINARLPEIAHTFAVEKRFEAFNPIEGPTDATYGIIAGGISAAYAREALRMVEDRAQQAGISMPPYRFMQVGLAYPFPEETVSEFVRGLRNILVFEELDFVIEDALARLAGRTHAAYEVRGKLTGDARDRGENDVDDIATRIEKFLGLSGRLRMWRRSEALDAREAMEQGGGSAGYESPSSPVIDPATLPTRPPVLCPGCPHRGAFYAVKQALRKTPAVLCGDIGCYTLGNARPLDAVDTCLCMGAGITMAQGFAVADPDKKAVAFVGDSTFFASGMTGLANAAYNGHDISVMVLDNATTAMTGSQPHPGTGYTLMGEQNRPLDIEAALLAMGFRRVFRANPLDKDASVVAAKAAISYDGPSAVIFESPCVQLVAPNDPVVIDPAICTGCKKCITEIGCPAIGFDTTAQGERSGNRGQAFIDAAQCNGCDLCTQVCPFEAIRIQDIPADQTVRMDRIEAADAQEKEDRNA
ncbi:MAG TPA: indolepyruvate oxidoreductase [Eggerthellaceae bacterium]|nr:indolepyruvate oxidoreductase [Eggerthellaceae bacterium]